jgi:hypothetical protein
MTATDTLRLPTLSPELLRRIDALDGCQGRWIVDCRELEGGAAYALRALDDSSFWPLESGRSWGGAEPEGAPYPRGSAERAALYCAATRWQSRLLWCSNWLDDDCRWPGGYDAPSIVRSNARVFREDFARELERADGDADGLSLDVRFLTPEMLETLQALESYPLISEEDHSALEVECQQAEWEGGVRCDFRQLVGEALQELAPSGADDWWGEERAAELDDDALWWLFQECGPDWEEQVSGWCSSGYWCDLKRLRAQLTPALLAEGTDLPLLAPDQSWRHDPYPWPGAAPAPLVLEAQP